MAKYEVKFSCGHTEVKTLFGKTSERESRIKYWEEYGTCSACFREKRAIELEMNNDQVEMPYRKYKEEYPDHKTKAGSWNPEKKTIIVYIPKNSLSPKEKRLEEIYEMGRNLMTKCDFSFEKAFDALGVSYDDLVDIVERHPELVEETSIIEKSEE